MWLVWTLIGCAFLTPKELDALLDADGDGHDAEVFGGDDCNDDDVAVHPGANDPPYDGLDDNCDGSDDFDADGDGHRAVASGGDDCWDLPGTYPAEYVAIAGASQLEPSEVHPDVPETWYDGIDADCSGGSDFDQDGDGADSSTAPQADGSVGDDCYDAVDPDCDTFDDDDVDCSYPRQGPVVGEPAAPADIHPTASDPPYDGTDQDCDATCHDYDQDCDGHLVGEECDDTDPAIYPDDSVPEVWGNCDDENCDGNFADQDGDGWLVAGVEDACAEALTAADLDHLGDCWDDPTDSTGWTAANGLPDPTAADVHPTADDPPYDGLDEDCAGGDDYDADGDGYRTAELPDDSGVEGDDCDDARGDIHPGAVDTWYDGDDSDCAGDDDYDQDHDGHPDPSDPSGAGDDCDDSDAAVNPDEAERCSTSADDDCTGTANDPGAVGCTAYFTDADGDGHAGPTWACLCEPDGATAYAGADDCDDGNPAISPEADERCATVGVDDDCDSEADEPGAPDCVVRYLDADGDGHGTTASECACDASGQYTAVVADDCNDGDADVYPGATERCNSLDDDCDGTSDDGASGYYPDDDGDGYGDSTAGPSCWAAGMVTNNLDCDDHDAGVNPGATEACNDVDDDCDGTADDGLTVYYTDSDRDGHGRDGSTPDCSITSGVTNHDDCNDSDNTVYAGATEACDDVDDDCDGVADDGLATWYIDSDGDGHGRSGSTADCSYASTGSTVADDCNDSDSTVYTGAPEQCDDVDDDCDGTADDGLATRYVDSDGDGHGRSGSTADCSYASTGSTVADDCNDGDNTVYVGATETCDGVDDDCDGTIDDGLATTYTDSDRDGYGSGGSGCSTGTGRASNNTDCDDTRSAVNPGATETCSTSYDDDCDGSTNDVGAIACANHYYDVDNDGYGTSTSTCICTNEGYYRSNLGGDCNDSNVAVNPGATEVCNSIDDDCDASTDEGVQYYADADGDTYGAGSATCSSGAGYVSNNTDCDDADTWVYPGATELCDGQYNNCTTSGSWTPASENNMVSRVSGTAWSNVTVSTSSASVTSVSVSASYDYYVCPGTYYARFSNTGGNDMNIYGSGSGVVTLDGGAGGSVVSITNGGTSTISGVTMRNGTGTSVSSSTYGGAVYVNYGTAPGTPTLTIDDCVLEDSAADYGGILGVRGSAWVAVSNTDITGGDATDGGGLALLGAGKIDLTNVNLFDNVASGRGGGGYVNNGDGQISLDGTLVTGNIATSSTGGGFHMATGDLSCISGGVYDNLAGAEGGGVYVNATSTASVDSTDCDWGTGGSDNACSASAPCGIDLALSTTGSSYNAYESYGSAATFTCIGYTSGGGGSSGTCSP